MKAKIFEIKRFAVHDGDGIRTTVFFKGCPLKCVWCHNPEGIAFKEQLSFLEQKCIGCGECVGVCPVGAHTVKNGIHVFDRDKCTNCGECEKVCLGAALKLYGREMSVDELLPILLEDKSFYNNTGGGVTLSGGECLCHADFCAELLKLLKQENINTAVDTCGFVSRDAIDKVIPYTDVFLYDFKAYDEDVHLRCTGQSNRIILDNLRYIDNKGKKIEIRIPYVPDYNSEEVVKMIGYMKSLKNLTKVRVLPYHNYAGSKYQSLGMLSSMPEKVPTDDEIKNVKTLLTDNGIAVV